MLLTSLKKNRSFYEAVFKKYRPILSFSTKTITNDFYDKYIGHGSRIFRLRLSGLLNISREREV